MPTCTDLYLSECMHTASYILGPRKDAMVTVTSQTHINMNTNSNTNR